MSDAAKVLAGQMPIEEALKRAREARPLTGAELGLLCWIFEDDKGALKRMYPAMYERLRTLRDYELENSLREVKP